MGLLFNSFCYLFTCTYLLNFEYFLCLKYINIRDLKIPHERLFCYLYIYYYLIELVHGCTVTTPLNS